MILDHLESFAGLPVADFTTFEPGSADLPPADAVAWRLDCGWDEDRTFDRMWREFLDTVATDRSARRSSAPGGAGITTAFSR
ncbi:hypothetical protein ABZS86_25785 [Streptomyces sp. NPDC005355]|uniref:hypothetical protein n=1 Tax=Streptomyces sp. NPDC005355 TaxID=3157038 RepID=UPI0033AC39BB